VKRNKNDKLIILEILKSKFDTNNDSILQVYGILDGDLIAGNVAKHFQRVCSPLSVTRNDELRTDFIKRRSIYD